MADIQRDTRKSPNHSSRSSYGYGTKIQGITVHHWGADGQNHDGVDAWLTNPASNVSAHKTVSGGRITRLVADSRAAWHAGNNKGNGTTLGVECRPEMSTRDFDTLVQACADWEQQHGKLKYYGHRDWKSTACPGRYYQKLGKLRRKVRAEVRRRTNGSASKGTMKLHRNRHMTARQKITTGKWRVLTVEPSKGKGRHVTYAVKGKNQLIELRGRLHGLEPGDHIRVNMYRVKYRKNKDNERTASALHKTISAESIGPGGEFEMTRHVGKTPKGNRWRVRMRASTHGVEISNLDISVLR